MSEPKSYPLSRTYGIFASHWAVIHALAGAVNQSQMELPPLREVDLVVMLKVAAAARIDGGNQANAVGGARGVMRGLKVGDRFELEGEIRFRGREVSAWPGQGSRSIFSTHTAVAAALLRWTPILRELSRAERPRAKWIMETVDNMTIAAAKSIRWDGDDFGATEAAYQVYRRAVRTYIKQLAAQEVN